MKHEKIWKIDFHENETLDGNTDFSLLLKIKKFIFTSEIDKN